MGCCVLAAGGPTLFSSIAHAESLQDALTAAYRLNPMLEAERARLRATDENVAIAKSQTRPTVTGDADIGYEYANSKINSSANASSGGAGGGSGGGGAGGGTGSGSSFSAGVQETNPRGFGIQLEQPLFRGFRALNSIRETDANVRGGREALRASESQTLLDGVTVYVDVVRDQAIVRLNENNVKVLSEQLKATQDRFDVGEVTRTDVAQAEARRAGAISDLNVSQANLKTSRANYERIIGHPPSGVSDPPSVGRLLPNSVTEANAIADGENPTVLAAAYDEQAALHAVNVIIGELLPEASVLARWQDRFGDSRSIQEQEAFSVVGRVTVPFYQRGEVAARTRQAKEVHFQTTRMLEQARLNARAQAVSSFGVLNSARAQIKSAQSQVDANKVALAGVREEARVGQRTVLDTLNAEQEYLNSQVSLVSFKRDATVAEYALLSAIGRLTAPSLDLPVPYYDPGVHYDLVRNKWLGLAPDGLINGTPAATN